MRTAHAMLSTIRTALSRRVEARNNGVRLDELDANRILRQIDYFKVQAGFGGVSVDYYVSPDWGQHAVVGHVYWWVRVSDIHGEWACPSPARGGRRVLEGVAPSLLDAVKAVQIVLVMEGVVRPEALE